MAFLLAVMGGAAAVELVKRISGREEPVKDENEVLRRQRELQRLLQVLAQCRIGCRVTQLLSVPYDCAPLLLGSCLSHCCKTSCLWIPMHRMHEC